MGAAVNANKFDYFRRGLPEPYLSAKSNPTTALDYFRRGLPTPGMVGQQGGITVGTVSVSAITTTTLTVSTTAASGGTGPYNYQFQRAPDSGGAPGTWANIGSNSTATTFNDTSLSAGTVYWYRCIDTDSLNATATSAAISTITLCAAPTGLSATAGDTTVALSWSSDTGASTYNIYRATTSGSETQVHGGVTGTSYTDSGLTDGTTYYYKITAVDASGESALSSEVSATPTLAAPGAPTGLSAVPANARVTLTWVAGTGTTTSYKVFRGTSPGGESATPIATPSLPTYVDTGLTNGTTYYYTVAGVNSVGTGAQSGEASATPQIVLYLPTQALFAQAKGAAYAANPSSAMGQAYLASQTQLDAALTLPISKYPGIAHQGIYEGNGLVLAAEYAAGYIAALGAGDAARSSKYADKAIGAMLYGLNANQRGDQGARKFIARGDGTTVAFTIPDSTYYANSLAVYTAPIAVSSIVKGASGGQDVLTCPNPYYQKLLKVSNANDGTANYLENTDWRYNPNYVGTGTTIGLENQIDWSLNGTQPTTGATYYVTSADMSNMTAKVSGTDYTVSGQTVTFAVAPPANTTVFFRYVYGVSGPGYQNTVDGRGGVNNALIDSGYPSRYLQYVAMAFDWLYGYSGFSSGTKAAIALMLQQWSDAIKTNGYVPSNGNASAGTDGSSNYVAGHFAARAAVAIALQGRDAANGLAAGTSARLKSEVQTMWANQILPSKQAPTGTDGNDYGGQWTEGWNYGAQASRIETHSAWAYEQAGWGSASAFKVWSGAAIKAILAGQPTLAYEYDGGDSYSAATAPLLPFLSKDTLYVLSAMASDATAKAYGNYAIQHTPATIPANDPSDPTVTWVDLCFRDPNAVATNWTATLPLAFQSPGSGVIFSRASWNYNDALVTFHCGNLAVADHQEFAQGTLEISSGADPLLVLYASATGDETFQNKSRYGNLVAIDDGGAGTQNYSFAQGVWYAGPNGCTQSFDSGSGYAYSSGNYAAAWEKNTGTANPTTECVRNVLHVPGSKYVFTYDRVTTTAAGYSKQLQFQAVGTVSTSGNGFTIAQGGSKLFGQTFASVGLTTATGTVVYGGVTVNRVLTNPTSNTAAAVRYLTAYQIAPSSAGSMDSSAALGVSADGKNDGALLGHVCAVFGRNGAIAGATSYVLTDTLGATTTHYVSDLSPNTPYTLTGAAGGSVLSSPGGVAVFTSTGTGAAQTITLSPGASATTYSASPALLTLSPGQSDVFTFAPNGPSNATVTATPSGGSFSPATITFDGTAAAKTATYTAPAIGGTVTILYGNSGSLTNPANTILIVLAPASPIQTPLTVTLVTRGYVTRDLPPIVQGSTPIDTWTIVDASGNPVNLAGKEIRLVGYSQSFPPDDCDPYDATPTEIFKQSSLDGSIVVGGAAGNVVSVAWRASSTATAGKFSYLLLDATDLLPLVGGRLKIKPAVW